MKLSEEAGIQMFGPDNVAIQKVRIIVILTSSILFLVLLHDSGKYETLFNPAIKNGTEIKQVIYVTPLPFSPVQFQYNGQFRHWVQQEVSVGPG